MIAFTYPLDIDGYTIAEIDGIATIRVYRDGDWTLEEIELSGIGADRKRRNVPAPTYLRHKIAEWLLAEKPDILAEEVARIVEGNRAHAREMARAS